MTLATTEPVYSPLNEGLIAELKSIFGDERISDRPEDVLTYSFDATRREYAPHAVAWPESAEEISQLVHFANRHRVPLYPRGGGTGFTGGALATQGGITISMERMDRIIEIDEANRLVTAETGVVLGTLKSALQERGLFYPPDPSSAKSAALGGTLAECAGGLNCVKYGTTKDWVQSIKAVLPNGEIVNVGTKARKNVVGYNLLPLLIGSEGTLAIITEATLRLLPYPTVRRAFTAVYGSVSEAMQSVQKILLSGVTPSALEFIDRRCLEAANHYMKDERLPVDEALLLVESDGFDEARMLEEQQRLIDACRANGAKDIQPSKTEAERAALWSIRKNLSPAMHAIAPFKTNEDICVPISEIEGILNDAYAIGDKYQIATLCFGHAGDGNIHVNFMTHDEQDPNIELAVEELFAATVKRNGSISGEHGIGIMKAPYLELELGRAVTDLLVQFKAMMDPNQILNPEKIIPKTRGA